jgi:hypothetical protein
VPRRNFGFEKRQKEIAKKEKKQLKLQRRLDRAAQGDEEPAGDQEQAPEQEPTE